MIDKLILISIVLFQLSLFAESYQDYVQEIECNFAKRMKRELDLHWAGTSGKMQDKIEEMGMKFTSNLHMSIEEARALELYVINEFVQAVNAHEKIQPFLEISPFTYKRVEILITFDDENNRRIADGSVCYISSISDLATSDLKNHIVYNSYDPFRGFLKTLLEEPYEEAVRKYNNSPVEFRIQQARPYEKELDLLFASFTKEMKEKYDLYNWAIGGDLINGIKTIGATFKLYQPITLEESRQLLVAVSEKLLHRINSNDKIRPYLEKYPLTTDSLRIALLFEEGDLYIFSDERIASAKLENNNIQYTLSNTPPPQEGKKIRLSREVELDPETYQEALKILQKNPIHFAPKSPSVMGYLQQWLYNFMYYTYFFIAVH